MLPTDCEDLEGRDGRAGDRARHWSETLTHERNYAQRPPPSAIVETEPSALEAAEPYARRLRPILWTVAITAAVFCALSVGIGQIGLMPAPESILAASLVGLGASVVALALNAVFAPPGRRFGAFHRLVRLSPSLLVGVGFLAAAVDAPRVINRVTLPDGRMFLLGLGSFATDVDYQLWEAVDPYGLIWSRSLKAQLNLPAHGQPVDAPILVASPDGKWLLVRRGDLWSDCFEATQTIYPCQIPILDEKPDFRQLEAWVWWSSYIQGLTGLSPTSTAP